ncbi:hypothetical protein T4C_1482 [Trichinella pseudospiralis]|uniref:Uncharacterized protein n=2 Tax=Trichinella pseudospiralis TaxID=6337 RepID=A0A0V1JQN1_TRIPS|nr:hypothetical protein T4C_1482 [Trichinella pseudospiralis]
MLFSNCITFLQGHSPFALQNLTMKIPTLTLALKANAGSSTRISIKKINNDQNCSRTSVRRIVHFFHYCRLYNLTFAISAWSIAKGFFRLDKQHFS